MKSLEPFSTQADDEMKAGEMEDAEARESCQNRREKGLSRTNPSGTFRGSKAVRCFMVKKLQLTAEQLLMWKAVSKIVMRFDAAQ